MIPPSPTAAGGRAVTPAEYSRHRNCDLKSVTNAIDAGRIDVTDDGMIADPAEADLQRAERSLPRRGGPQPNGHAAPTDLTMVAANRRRVEASCADLEDELHVLRSTCA